nr:hypothetical protein CFP56_01089 [Quercus suber]
MRNPFRKQDENARPSSQGKPVDVSDATRPVDVQQKAAVEYKLSVASISPHRPLSAKASGPRVRAPPPPATSGASSTKTSRSTSLANPSTPTAGPLISPREVPSCSPTRPVRESRSTVGRSSHLHACRWMLDPRTHRPRVAQARSCDPVLSQKRTMQATNLRRSRLMTPSRRKRNGEAFSEQRTDSIIHTEGHLYGVSGVIPVFRSENGGPVTHAPWRDHLRWDATKHE